MKKLIVTAGLLFFGLTTAFPAQAFKVEIIMSADELLQKAKDAFHSGRLDKARFYYEEAIYRDTMSDFERVVAHSDLCVVYMFLERFEEAIAMCKKSLELMPNRWETVNNLGTVFLVQGDYSNAIRQYERGLSMKPKSQVLRGNKALALKRAKEASLESKPDNGGVNLDPGGRYQDSETAT